MADIKPENTTPLISLITINYNQTSVTCDLLKSTRSISCPYFDIVVVDNGNREAPTSRIRQANYPTVKVISHNYIN